MSYIVNNAIKDSKKLHIFVTLTDDSNSWLFVAKHEFLAVAQFWEFCQCLDGREKLVL